MPRGHTQQQANEAASLLENATLQQAADDVRETLVRRIIAGDALSPEQDHELCNLLRASDLYWKVLKGRLRTGDVELFNQAQKGKVA